MAASSAAFWLLMERWGVPEDQALKLIGFEGKPRRRFKLTPDQVRMLTSISAVDSALELAGMDRAWLHSRSSRLRRRTPLERMQAGAFDDVLRAVAKEALTASVGQRVL